MPRQRRGGGQLPLLDEMKRPVLSTPLFHTSMYSPPLTDTAWGEEDLAEPGRLATAVRFNWHSDVFMHCHPRI